MQAAIKSTTHFQAVPDPVSLVMNFDLDWLDQKTNSAAAGCSRESIDFTPRSVRRPVAPIEITFGHIDILWKLDKRTLERMAISPCTPVVVLERLADHPMAEVRAAVAENSSTPMYVLVELSKDSDCDVRFQLAENHRLPMALLKALCSDGNPYVAWRAQKTYDRLSK